MSSIIIKPNDTDLVKLRDDLESDKLSWEDYCLRATRLYIKSEKYFRAKQIASFISTVQIKDELLSQINSEIRDITPRCSFVSAVPGAKISLHFSIN